MGTALEQAASCLHDSTDRFPQPARILQPEAEVSDSSLDRLRRSGSAFNVMVSRAPGVRRKTMKGPSRNISSIPNTER